MITKTEKKQKLVQKNLFARKTMKDGLVILMIGLLSILGIVGGVAFIILTICYLGTAFFGIISSKKITMVWLFIYESGLVVLFILNVLVLGLILYLFLIAYLILGDYSTDVQLSLVYIVFFLLVSALVFASFVIYCSFKNVRAFIKFLKTPDIKEHALIEPNGK